MARMILVIDPQEAFCSERGSLAKAFGVDELSRIQDCLVTLDSFLSSYSEPSEILLVRSQYRPGQFTNSDLSHPYALACVPGNGIDCDWSLSSNAVADKSILTKYKESAATASGFLNELRTRASNGLDQIYVAGFLTTSCVLKTVLDLRRELPEFVEISLLKEYTASRASNYKALQYGQPRHDEALRSMQTCGIRIIKGFGSNIQ
jgi:nicotinamidase-related amidase